MQADAEQALRREAVLTAVVQAEEIEPSEQQLLDALRPIAEREGIEAQKLLEELSRRGRLEEVREDLAVRDPGGTGPRPRAAVDARQGRGGPGRDTGRRRGVWPVVDTRPLASRGIRSAKRNKGEDYEPTCPNGR
jgi:hypothetical protein